MNRLRDSMTPVSKLRYLWLFRRGRRKRIAVPQMP